MMRLGFIGTGRITTALVEGFCTTPDPPASIIVSPRNAEKATQLAVRFRHVTVAKDNQAIVDGCDCVFLALRPPMVSVLGEIRFRPEQRIISLMPTRPFTQITSPRCSTPCQHWRWKSRTDDTPAWSPTPPLPGGSTSRCFEKSESATGIGRSWMRWIRF